MKKLTALLFLFSLTSSSALAEEPAPSAEQQKAMQAWQKAATPGPEHAKLKAMAGSYDCTVSMWMDPKAPPQESKGTAELKPIMGDRFVQQEFSGSFMGQPFTGMGLSGYDNVKKKYFSTWVDNTSTAIYAGEGTADKDGVITFVTTMSDPITGKVKKGKDILRPGTDGFTFESYGTGPKGGKEFKMLEIKYAKKK